MSYTLLTVNANNHALLRHYQQPGAEKRIPVVLNEGAYGAWLTVRMEKAKEFMRQYAPNGWPPTRWKPRPTRCPKAFWIDDVCRLGRRQLALAQRSQLG